uniref:Uncharacterized protein n=1 Tax=Trichuris muris TaxID=70415 RepID=A0A5S6Q7Z5_TRIMR
MDEKKQGKKSQGGEKETASPGKNVQDTKERMKARKRNSKSTQSPRESAGQPMETAILHEMEKKEQHRKPSDLSGRKETSQSKSDGAKQLKNEQPPDKKLRKAATSRDVPTPTYQKEQIVEARSESQVPKESKSRIIFDDNDDEPVPGFDRSLTRRAWDCVPVSWESITQARHADPVRVVQQPAEDEQPKPNSPRKKSIWRTISDPFRKLKAKLTGARKSKDPPPGPSKEKGEQ